MPGGVRLQVVVPVVLALLLHVRVHDARAVLRGEQQVEPRHGDAEIHHDRARVLHDDLLGGVGDIGGQGRAGPELRRDRAGVGGLQGIAVERRPVAVLDAGPQRERPDALVRVRRNLLGEPRLGLGGAVSLHAHQRVVDPEVRARWPTAGSTTPGRSRSRTRPSRRRGLPGSRFRAGPASARLRRRGGRAAAGREQAARRAHRHRAGSRPGGAPDELPAAVPPVRCPSCSLPFPSQAPERGQADHLVGEVRGQRRGDSAGVVARDDLHHVEADEVDAAEPADDLQAPARTTGRPPPACPSRARTPGR